MLRSIKNTFIAVVIISAVVCAVCLAKRGTRLGNAHPFVNNIFVIKAVNIQGNKELSKHNILKTAGIKYGDSVFKYSPKEIRTKIENLSEVEYVTVKRKLPCIYDIYIKERTPIAYWKDGATLYFVDDKGAKFPVEKGKGMKKLPLTVGAGAPKALRSLIKCLDNYPSLKSQIVFCNWVGNRRWNLQINDDILVKLPEDNLKNAIDFLNKICTASGKLDDNLSMIDLRIENRIIIRVKKKKGEDSFLIKRNEI